MINLTPAEEKLIEHTRNAKIDFGRMFLTLHYENGKLIRAEPAYSNVVESWMLRETKSKLIVEG